MKVLYKTYGIMIKCANLCIIGIPEEEEREKGIKNVFKEIVGLPWWHSGEESTCQCRGQGFYLWSGKIPHAVEQLSPCLAHNWACTLEPASHNYWAREPQLLKPVHLEPVLHNKRSHHNEKPAHCNKEYLTLAATRESPCTAIKSQCSQK